MNEGLEIEVYHFSDPLTKVTTLNNAKKHKALEELKSTGGGSFEIAIDDPKIVANPGLLAGRNVYKLRVDGTVVSAFIRDKRKKHMVTPGENGDTRYEIAGPGLKAWFDDAEVRPRGGLKARSQNDRHFNFATEQGAWYNSANWVNPTIIGTILVSPYDKTRPEKWPENTPAKWIWGSPHTMPTMPLGNCYFRYEITTATDERYVLYTAADDNFTLYIDGEKKVETDPDATALSETVRTEFFMPAGNHVIAYRTANGTLDGVTPRGPAAFVAALFVLNGEQETLVTKTGDAGWKVNAYPASEPGWTAGEVLLKLMAEAESRGVLFPTWLTPTFTATHDSQGLPWTDKLPWSFKVGDSLLNVINQMEELIGDIWIDPDTYELNFVPKRGNDFSFTQVYEDLSVREAITFRKGYNLLDATIEGRSKLKNALSVKTDLGWMNVEDEGTSISTYGRLEGTLKVGAPRAVSEALADVVISQRKTEEEGATYEIAPTTKEMPFVEFNVGDYVAAPNELNEPVSRRVLSISVEQDSNGRPKYSIEFDVIFRENEDRLNKIINKIGAGGVGGDFSGVTNPDTGFGDPVVIPPPAVPPTKFPLPPTGVSITSVGNWTTNGATAYSEVTVDWDPVTSNTDGSLTTPEYYEVWGKAVGADGDPFEQFARVTGTIATIQPFVPGVEYQYYVIARNPSGEASAQSTLVSHTPVGPTTPLAAPSTPTVTSDKGNLIITWDGLLGGMSPLPQFRYVYAKVATTAGGTYTQRGQTLGRGGGNIVVSGLTVGQAYHVKLVAVDGAGIASPDSLSASTTLTGISLGSLESDVAAAIQAAQDAADAAQIDADAAAIAAGNALTAANTAQTDANTALTAANGKSKIIFSTSAASGTAYSPGDIWFQKSGSTIIGQWEFVAGSPGSWQSRTLTNAVISTLDAGKITTGTLDANRIGARTISAEKLVIGDFENRLNNPSFEFSSVGWTLTAQASIVTITDPPAGGNKALQVVANGTIIDINSEYMSVTPGDKWYAEVWVRKVSGTDTSGNVQLGATIVGDNGFTVQYPSFALYSIAGLADGAWDKISGIVTIPANAARMLVRMSVRNDVADGTYQFDGAALRRMNTGEVIVDGIITTQKLAAESVTATVIAADSIAAYHIQANTITAAEIASETITGEEILARSISADRMELGTLTVNELHPSVGSQLNISANEAVNILVGQITGVESNLDSVSDDLDVMQTYYQFGAEGATISSPGSIYQVALRSDRIQMLQGGVEVSYWNAGQLHVNSFIGETVILSNHQIAKYGNDTVVRKA